MKVSLASLVALLALLFVHSCKETAPTKPDEPIALSLSLLDSTCTDLELVLSAPFASGQRLVVERLAQPAPIVIFDAVLNKSDTMILDTDLLPNTTYTYRAYRLANNAKRDSTPALHARTMDTTSHDWTWTMETFGVLSSQFDDVAIINDTLAYAVGKIYLNDSLGQNDPTPYNLAVWNGQSWRFERRNFTWRLLYPNSGGEPQGTSSIRSIFAFNSNDIWIAAQTVQHWNGTTWTEHAAIAGYDNQGFPIAAGGALKIWGSSSSNLYFVGRGGLIIHYNGSSWRKIESGTSLDIYDIYGDGEEVLAVGSVSKRVDRVILKITPTVVIPLSQTGVLYRLQSIWFETARQYIGVGEGVYEKRCLSDSVWRTYPSGVITSFASSSIRGNHVNDILIVGSFGEVLHWNGINWRNDYRTVFNLQDTELGGVVVKKNLTIATGFKGQQACILIGRR
jgi:hypothetical protein